MDTCQHCNDVGRIGLAADAPACQHCRLGYLMILLRIVSADEAVHRARQFPSPGVLRKANARLREAMAEAHAVSARIEQDRLTLMSRIAAGA